MITDWSLGEAQLLSQLARLRKLGPRVGIQHRHPGVGGRQFLAEGRALQHLARDQNHPLFVNGRLDVALLMDAHLHLPSNSIRVKEVRAHLPPGRWVSVAVHDLDQAREADGADLALVSPVFLPFSKPDDRRPALGVTGLLSLAAALPCPAYALGGIDFASVAVLSGAAPGCAVMSSVLRAPEPENVATALLAALEVRNR